MADPLQGPRLKLERANRHIDELKEAIDRWGATNPQERIATENDPEPGDLTYRIRVKREPPPEWGPIVGDALHNLRTALDLLAEQLILNGGEAPTDTSGFPLGWSKKVFENTVANKLPGVSGRALRIVKAMKPYNGGNPCLWLLHRLNIADKHHLLVPVAVGQYRIRHRTFAGRVDHFPEGVREFVDGLELTLTPTRPPKPLKDGDVLMVMRAATRREGDPHPNFDVAIVVWETGTGADGQPVVGLLREIGGSVARLLNAMERWVF
ncbi:MAG: hypothetical protein WEE36_06825 [Acidimicrobiia bacterium]